MDKTIFTDYGTVKFTNFPGDNNYERSLNEYLNTLEKNINRNSSLFLVYDKEENNLYSINNENKCLLVLTDDLKKEFDNNLDTDFNKKIRELLELSKEKEKFFSIDSKGTFDSIEEADFYIKYLEKFTYLSGTDEMKLKGARGYIKKKADKNSDIYKYHVNKEKENAIKIINAEIDDLNDEKSIKEKYLNEYNSSNNAYKVMFAVNIIIPLLILALFVFTNTSLFFIIIIAASLSIISGAKANDILNIITDNNSRIKRNKEDLDEIIEEINKYNEKLTKINGKTEEVKEQTKEETKTNTVVEDKKEDRIINYKDCIKNEIKKITKEISDILKNDQLLDAEEKIYYVKKALEIMDEYKEKYKEEREKKKDIELTTDGKYSSQIKTYIEIHRLKSEINDAIKSKMEINDFNLEIEELTSLLNSSLSNSQLTKKQ